MALLSYIANGKQALLENTLLDMKAMNVVQTWQRCFLQNLMILYC